MHDVVSCPESEYPELHTGSQLAPDASSVSPAHDPASALSGFVSFGYVSAVHAFAAHVESVTSPAAEHDVGPDSVYPLAHSGVHDLPAASVVTPSQLPLPVPLVGLPVPVAKDTVQCFTHVAFVSVPSEHDVVFCPAIVDSEYPSLHAGTHDSPVGSAVTAPQLPSPDPALPLSGFDMTAHVVSSAVQTPPVATPSLHTKGASNVNPGLHMGSQDTSGKREVFPSQSPARPLTGGMVKLVHVVGSAAHTTFVNAPVMHVAAVGPVTTNPVSHVGVQVFPESILSLPLLPLDVTAPDV